jgi:hypothetical protein
MCRTLQSLMKNDSLFSRYKRHSLKTFGRNDKTAFLHSVLFTPWPCFSLGCDLPYWAISHQLLCWRKHLYLAINHQRENRFHVCKFPFSSFCSFNHSLSLFLLTLFQKDLLFHFFISKSFPLLLLFMWVYFSPFNKKKNAFSVRFDSNFTTHSANWVSLLLYTAHFISLEVCWNVPFRNLRLL